LSNNIINSDISCVALTNNSCRSYFNRPGLILLLSTVAMSNCVFLSNRFDYFIGAISSFTGNITFISCVFDVQSLNKTLSISLSTIDCTYESRLTSLAPCPAAPGSDFQLGVVIGGCIGAVAIIVVVVVVVVLCLYKRRKFESSMEDIDRGHPSEK
jgi:hypothetical protein